MKTELEWFNVSEKLLDCDGETVFVGINSARYMCCFNSFGEQVGCFMESPEDSVWLMSDLEWWAELNTPELL